MSSSNNIPCNNNNLRFAKTLTLAVTVTETSRIITAQQ